MKLKRHPALALFEKLFIEASIDPGPVAPSYYVPTSVFYAQCKGISEAPKNIIEFFNWCERIGVDKLAQRLITAHYKAHGTKRSPVEAAAIRFHNRRKRNH